MWILTQRSVPTTLLTLVRIIIYFDSVRQVIILKLCPKNIYISSIGSGVCGCVLVGPLLWRNRCTRRGAAAVLIPVRPSSYIRPVILWYIGLLLILFHFGICRTVKYWRHIINAELGPVLEAEGERKLSIRGTLMPSVGLRRFRCWCWCWLLADPLRAIDSRDDTANFNRLK